MEKNQKERHIHWTRLGFYCCLKFDAKLRCSSLLNHFHGERKSQSIPSRKLPTVYLPVYFVYLRYWNDVIFFFCFHRISVILLQNLDGDPSLFICYDKLNVCLYPFQRARSSSDDIFFPGCYRIYSETRVNEPCDTISCTKSRSLWPSFCFSPEAAACLRSEYSARARARSKKRRRVLYSLLWINGERKEREREEGLAFSTDGFASSMRKGNA